MKSIALQKIWESLGEDMFLISLVVILIIAIVVAFDSFESFKKGFGKQTISHVPGLILSCFIICCILSISARPYLDYLYIAVARLLILVILSLTLYFFVMANKIKKYKKLKIVH